MTIPAFFLSIVPIAPNASLSLVVTPAANTIPSGAPLGTVVATLQGIWSDGSPFTGHYEFVAPNFDGPNHEYAILDNQLIISYSGPGVGPVGGSVQHVTIEAVW